MQIRRSPVIDGPILHASKKTGIVPLVTILFTIKKTVVRKLFTQPGVNCAARYGVAYKHCRYSGQHAL